MGVVLWHTEHCFGPAGIILDSELVLTAANGDTLKGTYTGSCTLPSMSGEYVLCSGHMVLSGGTGRFSDATGSGEWKAAVLNQEPEALSSPGRWEWQGTIRY